MMKVKVSIIVLLLAVGLFFGFAADSNCSISLDCNDGAIISCSGPPGTCSYEASEPNEPGWVKCDGEKTNCQDDDEGYVF